MNREFFLGFIIHFQFGFQSHFMRNGSVLDCSKFFDSFQCCWFDHVVRDFWWKYVIECEGCYGWKELLINVFGLSSENWLQKHNVILLRCREEFAVDTFVLCKTVEGRVTKSLASVFLSWVFSNKKSTWRSIIFKNWGRNSGFLVTETYLFFPLPFSEELSGGSSRQWNVLRWRLWSSTSYKSVTVLM